MNPRTDASSHAVLDAENGTENGTSTRRRSKHAAAALITTIGAAAVVSTAFALPAQANNTNAVWDRVAKCESGNRWHINTGNGFYGGLQFSAGTWRAYHGTKYAARAQNASRLEQIEVARRVLASQGPGAWPVCSVRAGLTRSNGHATRAPLPQHAGGTIFATHRKSSGAHKRGHHKTYKVRPGDTLSKIAHRLHVHGGWKALYKANRKHLSNPNVIHVGQVLTLP